ncbi:helix-turn-helix domain-containing protein [Pseudonocardia parietis]|uniref:DNA-binding PucR family transcriptional regulator n=1 Tax=Pseudonocardia parietis TaxID=570936 RepID=A0ABS4VZY6_9PSEU|nr:helix-turn-helix domain-containing protein [Pseudonocardia parietis]MBP2369497.1 DNA-binding PucR family transcriptional regulator [Pseudonocardia parietis]
MPPVSDTLARLAGAVRDDSGSLTERVLAEIDAGLPDLGRDPRVRELLVATIEGSLDGALTVLTGGGDPDDAPVPAAATDIARRLAQQGVAVTVLLRAYRLGQAAFQQVLISRIASAGLDADELAAAVRELSSVAFGYVDRVSEDMVAVHQSERDGWVRRRDAARLAMVDAVLAGRGGTASEVERTLGHPVTGEHLAAVFWSAPGVADPGRALERAVAAAGEALGCPRPPLVVAPDGATLWAWYPVPAARDVELEQEEVFAAFGTPEHDLDGFRRSHRRARQVQAVVAAAAPAARRAVTTAASLGPLLLLGGDVELLGSWVREVLGDLAADDEQHERLRDTVGAYLRAGGSLAAAAAELHLHKNSVQYRLRRAEEARGRALSEGRLDVEVALLACRTLGTVVLHPAD